MRARTAAGRVAMFSAFTAAAVAFVGFSAYEISENPANQLFGRTVVSGPSDERVVALTFDDGPNPPYTNEILDVLGSERVHATFFVVGRAAAAYPEILKSRVTRWRRDRQSYVGTRSSDHHGCRRCERKPAAHRCGDLSRQPRRTRALCGRRSVHAIGSCSIRQGV